ncbi:hypothetical protein DZ860_17665 [Vibrio sinensis]|uniref:Uncharacterized protein n=1 Tax=Vibrio sinensis TaxID=2302434 RepID=A0A3A6QK08_9VIBR|nr:hypothetical protein [Vibrio sinensis]RJX68353.1 hypothetical protein DZ860_17665 [Vibrio sinensis]
MKLFTLDDLSYNGAHQGVHSWNPPQGDDPYYWHPEWLHIAEDAMGLHPKRALEVPDGQTANEEHAKQAIIDHLNDR